MATHLFTRSLLAKPQTLTSLLRRLRPITTAVSLIARPPTTVLRRLSLSTQATSSSLNDPNPNWQNRPPKETILLDGCDFEHWLVVVETPQGNPTRDEIIDSYVETLAQVVGSEEEARMKIYSVSTRCYYAFGALVSEELSHKLKELPGVRWVLPDSYLDVKNQDYGGEPFINGQAVPYDPKYHEEWVQNNARANERNRRNDRPRNFDRSRNFERRRDFQNNPNANQGMQNAGPNMRGGAPPNQGPPPLQPHNMGGGAPPPPLNMGGGAPPPPHNWGGAPPNNMGSPPPNNWGGDPNMGGPPPPNSWGGAPPNNMGSPPPNNWGGAPNNMGGPPPPPNSWGGATPNQLGYPPNNNMGNMPGGNSR